MPVLLEGLSITLFLTFISILIGLVIGIALALGRIYGNKIISGICIGYIEIIRGTPLLVQLFLIYFGLPSLGVNMTPLSAALLGLSLNSGAYQAEYIRGSIQSIPYGQMVAARTIGMNKIQSIKNIILPQALRISIPAWSNELIYLLKYTSIAYLITVQELTAEGFIIAAKTYRYIEMFIIIAIIYLVITVLFTSIIDIVENKLRIPGIGAPKRSILRSN
jgi:polar amino acid transport system permease protein